MSFVRILATVALSLGAALAVGARFQPEPGETAEAPAAAAMESAALGTLTAGAPLRATLSTPVFATLTEVTPPARAPAPLVQTSAADPVSDADPGPMAAASCEPALTITAQPAAMLALGLTAPCDMGEPVAIAHGPLLLASTLDDAGHLTLALPALSPEAEVTVAFLDGRLLTGRIVVADFARFQRLVVTWDGPPVLDLHAFIGNAAWGEAGHIRAGQPISPASGFVQSFGDPEIEGPQARVYTFPVGIPAASGQVRVEAEVAVTPQSCGQTLRAQVHAIRDGAPVARRALDVAMPGCERIEGFVQVPDLIPDLRAGMAALN